jgi:hypothetical protein
MNDGGQADGDVGLTCIHVRQTFHLRAHAVDRARRCVAGRQAERRTEVTLTDGTAAIIGVGLERLIADRSIVVGTTARVVGWVDLRDIADTAGRARRSGAGQARFRHHEIDDVGVVSDTRPTRVEHGLAAATTESGVADS